MVGCAGRNARTQDAYPSLGYPGCSSWCLTSIRCRAHRHAPLPYTFGYLRPCKRLWVRPCSSRPTGSHLPMPHGKVLLLGWQRRARNPPVCFSTRPRTQECPTALESVRQQRENAHPHSCVDQARSRRRIAPPDRLICRYTNCTLDVHCHKRGLVSRD